MIVLGGVHRYSNPQRVMVKRLLLIRFGKVLVCDLEQYYYAI